MVKEIQKIGAIYIRLSSEEQAKEGYSPETQEEKVKEFFKANGIKWNEKHIYGDLGHSGSTDKRPGLQRLLEDAKNKEFDVLGVYRLDRFFRNLRLLINTAHELKELGIGLISVTEPFDTSTPTGRASLHLLGTMAEWQREVNLESRNEGAVKAAKEGKWIGSGLPPFGYDFNPKTQRLKLNKQEAKIVKMIFEWLVYERLTLYKIQKRLNEMKVPTKFDRAGRIKDSKSQGWWQLQTIWRILRREIYTGTYWWRKYKNPNRSPNKEDNLRPKEDWILIKVPAIISEELFKRAQEKLGQNRMFSPKKTKMLYFYQHKLVCGYDGRRYCSAFRRPDNPKHRGTIYYICPNRSQNLSPVKCKAPAIAESRLESVWENLKTLLSNPEMVFTRLGKYWNQKRKKANIQEKLIAIEKKLVFWRNKEERLAKVYSEGIIEIEIYKKQWEECKGEEAKLLEEEESLSQLLLTEGERQKRIDAIKRLYQQIKEGLKDASREIKYQVIQKLISKIIVKGKVLEIEYDLPALEPIEAGKIEKYEPISSFCFNNKKIK